jgi:hypothetical protein
MLLSVVGDEPLVLLVGQVVDPFLGTGNADRRLFLTRQGYLVDCKCGVERDLIFEAGLQILNEELGAGRARIECKDRIRLGASCFGKLDREIKLVRSLC